MPRQYLPFLLVLALLVAPAYADADTVVARVGGRAITQADLNWQFELFLRQSTGGVAISDEVREQLAGLKKQYLERMVQDAVVVQAAEGMGLAPDAATIDRRIEQAKQRLSGDAAFAAVLEQYGIPGEAAYRRMVYEAMSYKVLIGWIRQRLRVSDAALRMIYLLDRDSFIEPERICTAHILVPTQKEAEDIVAMLEDGADFAGLAGEYSQDPGSRARGGDLGCVDLGSLVPEFEYAALALSPGEISPPIKTRFGWHVILMKKHIPARVRPFVEAKGMIRARIEGLAIEHYIKNLVARTDVEIYPDRIR